MRLLDIKALTIYKWLEIKMSEANKKKFYDNLPESPGVYLMKDKIGRILYIGKAANLKRRVKSYFVRPADARIERMVSKINKVDYEKTDSALEALILEAKLIKKYQPPYNVRETDDKSFLYVEITEEQFPRVLLVRGKSKEEGERFGPFTSASDIRKALRILRRIFPYSIHSLPQKNGKGKTLKRPCLDYELGLCPGTCIGSIDEKEYLRNIKGLKEVLMGRKKSLLEKLEQEMKRASDRLEFEKAEKIKRQIFALRHIQDTALLSGFENLKLKIKNSAQRVEGYDFSTISGTFSVGVMVVFLGNKPCKEEYRKFKIRTVKKQDDISMLKEVLQRRFRHQEWALPNLILIDGGKGQVNAAKSILAENGLVIPVVGIAKGARRRKNEFVGKIPAGFNKNTLIKVRDEAHRFAVGYHRKLRSAGFL